MIPEVIAQKYGPKTAEDAFRRITQWLVSTRISSHDTIVFLDTIVDHEAVEEAKRRRCVDEMEFQRELLDRASYHRTHAHGARSTEEPNNLTPRKHGLKRTFDEHQQVHGDIETAYTLPRKRVKTNGVIVQGTIPVPTPVFKPAPAPALLSYGVIMGEPEAQTIACTASQDELPAAEMPLSQPASLQYLEFQRANLLLTAFGVTSPAAAIPCIKPNRRQRWKDAKYDIHANSRLTGPTCPKLPSPLSGVPGVPGTWSSPAIALPHPRRHSARLAPWNEFLLGKKVTLRAFGSKLGVNEKGMDVRSAWIEHEAMNERPKECNKAPSTSKTKIERSNSMSKSAQRKATLRHSSQLQAIEVEKYRCSQ